MSLFQGPIKVRISIETKLNLYINLVKDFKPFIKIDENSLNLIELRKRGNCYKNKKPKKSKTPKQINIDLLIRFTYLLKVSMKLTKRLHLSDGPSFVNSSTAFLNRKSFRIFSSTPVKMHNSGTRNVGLVWPRRRSREFGNMLNSGWLYSFIWILYCFFGLNWS